MDLIIDSLSKFPDLDVTDNLLRSVFLYYFNEYPSEYDILCKAIQNMIDTTKHEVLGSSRTRHYQLNVNPLFQHQSINKLFAIIAKSLYLKRYYTPDGYRFELDIYRKVTSFVYSYYSPCFLTVLGDCGLGIISLKADMELLQFSNWRRTLSGPFFDRIADPFTKEIYDSISVQINEIKKPIQAP